MNPFVPYQMCELWLWVPALAIQQDAVPLQRLCVDLGRPGKQEVDQGLEMYGESHDPVSVVRDSELSPEALCKY